MLPLRAFRSAFRSRLRPPRLTSTLRTPHCHFSSSRRSSVRPYTWQANLWYRRDGTPRSKREGAIYMALALLIWFSCSFSADIYTELDLIFYLIHVRRVNSNYQFDLSQPEDIVEYMFKLGQIDFSNLGKKQGQAAKEGFLHILTTYPEARAYICSQLEELRNLTMNDDVHQDTMKTARETRDLVLRVMSVIIDKVDDIHGIQHLKEEYEKSDEKDLYREVG